MNVKSWLKPVRGALGATLRTLWLLFLLLCLLQPIAYSQEPTTPPAPESPAVVEPGAQAQEPTSPPAPETAAATEASPADDLCDKTKNPGQSVRVIGDDEIFLVYRNDATNPYLRLKVIDYDLATSKLVTDRDESWSGDAATAANTWWLSAAAGDLNGTSDGKRMDRPIVGFQNSSNQLAAVAVPATTPATFTDWWCQMSGDYNRCDDVSFVSVAAGNLDKSSDLSDEVVLTFRDNQDDYEVMSLDGASNGNISTAADSWLARYSEDHHPGRERGDVKYLAIATGDLNGDGFDNEVVTAVRDSGKDLQVGVHRGDTLAEIFFWDSYSGNPKLDTVANTTDDDWDSWRPIDVTTGDLDGDGKDEVIVAARYGDSSYCYFDGIRLLVFDFKPENASTHALSIDTTVAVPNIQVDLISGYMWESPPTVRLSAGDLDGDGLDEIVLGYVVEYMQNDDTQGTAHEQPRLRTYDYFRANTPDWQANCSSSQKPGCIKQKAAYNSLPVYNFSYGGNEVDWEARLSIATGDVDADGKAEIAVSRIDSASHDVDLRVFDAESSLTQLAAMTVDLGTEPIHDPTVAMGDYDGDSKWGTYQGTCHDKMQALVQAVLHAPPYWPEGRGLNGCDNDWNTFAKFGLDRSTSETTETSLETHIGGSSGMEKTFKGVTASFSRGWERSRLQSTSVTTSTHEAVGTHTTPTVESPDEPSYETVIVIQDTQWCYDYGVLGLDESNPTATVTVPVCIYQEGLQAQTEKRASWWYADWPTGNGRLDYPDSWVPVGINLAEDKTQTQRIAYQRTTYSTSAPYGYAKLANDGNTDGAWANGSVAHTSSEVDPYWQLNLGGLQWIDAVQIWNRDSYTSQLKDFYLLVTEAVAWPTSCSVSGAGCSCDDPVCMKEQPGVWDTFVSGEAGRPTTLTVGQYGRNLRVQRETGTTAAVMNIAEVQVYGMPGTPDQWPSAISPATLSAAASSFTLTWGRAPAATRTTTIARPLYLVWSEDLYLSQGSSPKEFLTGVGEGRQQLYGSGRGKSLTVGLQTRKKRSLSLGIGYEFKQSQATTFEKGVDFGGQAWGLGGQAPKLLEYYFKPYVWMQQAVPEGGGAQEFLVLDYVVPTANTIANPVQTPDYCPAQEYRAASSAPLAGPQAPVVDSPTHPDPGTWYDSNAVTFTWEQPEGEPATVQYYDWVLDQAPDTIPTGLHSVLTTTLAYDFVQNGTYYLHVQAMSDEYVWGDTAHRMVRVDAKPPQVSLALDPPTPTGNGGWYITPVTLTVNAADTDGSGVTGAEVSIDGAPWQPYSPPLALNADTPGTTVYARATDALGNVSEPVSTTVKIDRTPPDSDTLVAGMKTNAAGNDVLVLAGTITDNLSGRAGMVLEQDGFYWGANAEIGAWPLPSDPAIEVNWYYTSTNDLGAGYHLFKGRAQDEAGNMEAADEIATVTWFPKASPDLGGSSIAASQTIARPGDVILFNLAARNGGWQEAHIAVTGILPEGLEPVLEALPPGVVYDSAMRTLTWPDRLLWPGWWRPSRFLARVDEDLGATSLEIQARFHAFWPNTDLLPAAERQQFEEREQTVGATARLAVDPNLPADVDVIAPWALLVPPSERRVAGAEVVLNIMAAPDASRMYLREWTPDPITGDWTVAQNSGWIDYSDTYAWTLSAGQGVKYLGIWVADGAGNVSTLTEHNLAFVNRMDGSQVLADGQRIQYRGLPREGDEVSLFLTTVSGDPDVYLWEPRNAFWPTSYANDTFQPGDQEYLSKQFEEGGRYLMEVQAVGESEYELSPAEEGSPAPGASRAMLEKARPEHPLTVSNPLSAGQLGPELKLGLRTYLPVVFKSQ
jgi:hypothetical protein